MEDRRAFLHKIVAGAAYAAPVIHTVASPTGLSGQSSETTGKGGMGVGMGMGMLVVQPPPPEPTRIKAPWSKKLGG